MAETSDSFNAKGSTGTSFETIDEGPRAFGVKVHSNDVCGVYGESMEHPPKVGEREAQVVPRTGVFGRGEVIGVEGDGDLVGVFGDGRSSGGDLAVLKQWGIGVVGHSSKNRAAVFQCDVRPGFEGNEDFLQTVNSPESEPETSAHIRLVPRPTFKDPQNNVVQLLPKNGLAGDFFVVYGGSNREAIIWFCRRSHEEGTPGSPAQWGLIEPTLIRNGGQPAVLGF